MKRLTFSVFFFVVTTFLVADTDLDDSHWFVIPENASFEQLRDFAQNLQEELRKRNKEHFDKHLANQLTQEENDAVVQFRKQCEKTYEEVYNQIEALPVQSKESKEFILRRKWDQARRIDSMGQRLAELKKLLDFCDNDPDLAEIRQTIYSTWFSYSIMNASQSELDQLFEQLLTDLKENELQAVYHCDDYFKRLSQQQSTNSQKMNANLEKILAILEKSQNEKVKNFIPKIEGSVRFYALPGQEAELKGVLMDGTEFDLANLKGKVVYIDFWATWCGPCIGEMPELHAKYLALKDAGFEVISYSIDDDFADLVAFYDKMKYTWKTISVLKSQEKEFRNYYDFYGAAYVPKTVLIGRDGKVIKTDVRGFFLDRELNQLFGDEMKKIAFNPDVPAELKLRLFLNHFMGSEITKEQSNEMYENVISFIEENKDNQNQNMESLCGILIQNLEIRERMFSGQSLPAPEYQPLTVMKRLLPALKDAKNTWLQEYAQTLEAKIRGLELSSKSMELEGILADGKKFGFPA